HQSFRRPAAAVIDSLLTTYYLLLTTYYLLLTTYYLLLTTYYLLLTTYCFLSPAADRLVISRRNPQARWRCLAPWTPFARPSSRCTCAQRSGAGRRRAGP